MKTRRSWLITIAIIIALFVAGWTASGQNKTQRTSWEYKTVQGRLGDAQLNQFGSEGWELLTVASDGAQLSYYFRRAR